MKKIKKILKDDMYLELFGIVIGIAIGIISYIKMQNMFISVFIGIVLSVVLIYIINRVCIFYIAKLEYNNQEKHRYISPHKIRTLDEKFDKIISLDEELCDFLDKYSSGKKTDLKETELNKKWQKKEKYFIKKADKIFSTMHNWQLFDSLLATEQICNIVDILKYFKPVWPNIYSILYYSDDLSKVYL